MNQERIDAHAHYYPSEHLKLIQSKIDEIYVKGSRFPAMEKMYNLDLRRKEMRAAKITKQILSVGPPGVDRMDVATALSEAKKCNDELASVVEKSPEQFDALAILPLQAMDEALQEMDRAIKDLGFKGVTINSNIARKPLDSPEFFSFYEKAAALKIPIYIHPTVPVCTDFQNEYILYTMLGFLFDSSLAVARLILSGVLDKFPNTQFVVSHLGTLLPYIKQRLDDQWLSYPPALRGAISMPPSNYLGRFYTDTVNNYPPSYDLAKGIFALDHILFGTDFPFLDSTKCVECVSGLSTFDETEKEKIFNDNATTLFKL
jgi:predicted TIM-barrel fold metal-dependent hydrolase